MQESVQRVSVFRPVQYTIGPEATSEVVESALNIYKMQIQPQFFDEQRGSFSIKAPGLGVVLSNNVFLETSWTIKCPSRYNIASALSAICSPQNNTNIEAVGGVGQAEVFANGMGPKIVLGGGDAMAGAISNVQLVANGASLSNARLRTYTNALDRVFFEDSVFQRRFSMCGGRVDQYDTKCVSSESGALKIPGFTSDSGIEKRAENLISVTTEILASPNAARFDFRKVRLRWPVRACGVLSPVGPFDGQSDSSPYKSSCIAIPHANNINLDFLFVGLKECLFRNLTSPVRGGADTLVGQGVRGGFEVTLDTANPPTLHCEYIRLGMWSQIPASISLSAFKIAVHDPTKTPTAQNCVDVVPALTRASVNRTLSPALPCVGSARTDGSGRCAAFSGNRYLECEWQVNSAQIASYLCFVLQKSSDMYVLGGGADEDAVGKRVQDWNYTANIGGALDAGDHLKRNAGLEQYFLARNTNACASIQQFSLEIMSSVGSYIYSGEKFPYSRGRHELFRDVLRHTCPNYLGGDIQKWRKHCGIVVLSASDFARGIASSGSSFPVQYSVKIKFASEREYINGAGAYGRLGASRGPAVLRDVIYGEPVMLEIFDRVELRLSPSSGLVSSQNLAHSTSMDLIARGGAQ